MRRSDFWTFSCRLRRGPGPSPAKTSQSTWPFWSIVCVRVHGRLSAQELIRYQTAKIKPATNPAVKATVTSWKDSSRKLGFNAAKRHSPRCLGVPLRRTLPPIPQKLSMACKKDAPAHHTLKQGQPHEHKIDKHFQHKTDTCFTCTVRHHWKTTCKNRNRFVVLTLFRLRFKLLCLALWFSRRWV